MRRGEGRFALLLAALIAVYLPALRGGMLWDDDAHVTRATLRGVRGLARIWLRPGATQQYYPALHSVFWLEHRLWGDAVLGYHLINVCWHAAAAMLLVCCLRELGFSARAAWLGAWLWAFHPVMVESVAWISEQKNTLSAAAYFAAGCLYLRCARGAGGYGWATVLFLFALLTKTVTATLPAALLVVLWWRERGEFRLRWHARRLGPWLAAGLAAGLLTAWVERRFIGAEGASFALTGVQRLALPGKVVFFYFGKLVWPFHLSFIYPKWTIGTGPGALLPSLLLVALGAGGWVWVRRHPQGPGRGVLAAGLIFVGTLFPALGFFNVYPFLFSYVADHFQYLAAASVLAGIAWALDHALPGGKPATYALLLLPAGLAVAAQRQSADYQSAETLYRATLARNPDAWLAHYNLAVILGARPGARAEARQEYRETVRLNPDHWAARNNLAALLVADGDLRGGEDEYAAALRLRPQFAEAHNNLALALAQEPSRREEAIAHLRAAIELRPDYDAAHANLGGLLLRTRGGAPEAVVECRRAVALAPDSAEYHAALGNALLALPGGAPDAVAEYRTALRLDPHRLAARVNLASVLAREPATLEEAWGEYSRALADAPNNAAVHFNYANALARNPAQLAAAAAQYRAALRLDPRDAEAHFRLAVTLLRSGGDRAEAKRQLQSAVTLAPGFTAAAQLLARLP